LCKLRVGLTRFEEGLDGDAEPPVGGDLDEVSERDRAERRALVGALDLDDVLVALGGLRPAHDDLESPARLSGVHVAVTQGGEERDPLRVLRPAEGGHGGLALVAVVARKIGERGVERLRVARRGSGEPRHEQGEREETTHHQAFLAYVPFSFTQSQPLSGLVY
jgi:hypothetical protein